MKKSSNKHNALSRRAFLTTAGGLTIGVTAYAMFPGISESENIDQETVEKSQITAWVHIAPNGQITIYNPAAEMGQGSMTALPVIIAEELDADWNQVTIEQSPVDVDTYGLKKWGSRKIMLTVGSFTVMSYYKGLRQAGAQARHILMHSVAQKWNVPIEELTTEPSKVIHASSGRKVGYGEIMNFLQVPDKVPKIRKDQLKSPEDFRLIGSVMPRYDIPQKINGSAQFGIDVRVPNMLYGVIERGKTHGAKPTLKNESAIRSMTGVKEIVPLDHGIGIVADSVENALAAKKKLEITWDSTGPISDHSSEKALGDFAAMAGNGEAGKIQVQQGDIQQSISKAAKTYTADYLNDYVYHAQMEPLNAVASVSPDGKTAEVWAGTQAAGSVAPEVAKVLGTSPDNITFHPQFLGGGLGRRSKHDSLIEAVELSKAVSQPVKLIWTREDDLRYGMYRPMSLQRMKAAVDESGKLTGLSHIIVGDGDGLLASGARNAFYGIPNQQVELKAVSTGVRLKHWRSVGHGPNKFAIESFIDEVAAGEGKDPLEFRRGLIKDFPKALKTLEKAAEMANWGAPLKESRAKGIAFGERSGALVTGICEISLDREKGKIRVHHFWCAADAGIIVQPDNAKAQMEGGIIMGMSSVFQERLTIENGAVQQSNFHDYSLLRMKDIPESIEIEFIPSLDAPKGIGEASLPIVAGAISNAFAALTGKRLRHLPFTPERVLAAL